MKPPVSIDALMEEWSKDAKIDDTEPQQELIRIPVLHSKYATIMSYHNLKVQLATQEYARLKKTKWEYFSGELNNEEDLAKYKLEPMRKKILRQDIPMYLDADEELTSILIKKAVHHEIVKFCESVLRELNARTYQLRSFMEWERYLGGK